MTAVGLRDTGAVSHSGRWTFVFTDVEGSTALWESRPEAMAIALEHHDAVIRDAIVRYDGTVFATAGDSFAAVFDRPEDAIDAVVGFQRSLQNELWPGELSLAVRVGVHVGVAQQRSGDFFGVEVSRCARVMSVASGGEVLVSAATASELIAPPDEITLTSVGHHRLKSLTGSIELFRLGAAGLRHDFEAIADIERLGLPPASRPIGRDAEMRAVLEALDAARLVTLVGLGGVGKTAIAAHVASTATTSSYDVVVWCDLAKLDPGAEVLAAIAQMLSARPQAGQGIADAIADVLQDTRALLVLDNCEHVLRSARSAVETLLHIGTLVSVAATSRSPLDMAAERVIHVEPLRAVDDAVALVLSRASAGGVTLHPGDAPHLVDLCDLLERHPLALELAAAALRDRTPAELVESLRTESVVLGRSDESDRHRSLRSTLDWSYGLLNAEERTCFDELAVFGAASFSGDAATRVLGRPGVQALLSQLVRQSLLAPLRSREGTRFRLLEPVRQYADAHLDPGRRRTLVEAHQRYFAAVAAECSAAAQGPDYSAAIERLFAEWDGLRYAIVRSVADGINPDRRDVTLRQLAHLILLHGRSEVGEWIRGALSERPTNTLKAILALVARLESDEVIGSRLVDEVLGDDHADLLDQFIVLAVASWTAHANSQFDELRTLVRRFCHVGQAIGPYYLGVAAGSGAVLFAGWAPDESARSLSVAAEQFVITRCPVIDVYAELGRLANNVDSETAELLEALLEYADSLPLPYFSGVISSNLAAVSIRLRPTQAAGVFLRAIDRCSEVRDWSTTDQTLQVAAIWLGRIDEFDAASYLQGYLGAVSGRTSAQFRRALERLDARLEGMPGQGASRWAGRRASRAAVIERVSEICRSRLP